MQHLSLRFLCRTTLVAWKVVDIETAGALDDFAEEASHFGLEIHMREK